MPRSRPTTPIAALALALALAVGPALGRVALAADPTITVQSGDTLTAISKRHGVSVRTIVELNALPDPNRILAGQQLRIGTDEGAVVPAPAQPPAAANAATHVVARGENLTRIARHHGVSVAAIVAANGIANPSRIFPGQQLSIPGAPVAAPAASPAAPMPASMAALVAGRDAVRVMITEEANRHGVPVPFALAVAWQESGWRQDVVSSAGAVGIMQLLPATAEWVGVSMLGEPVAIHDSRSNVRAGVRLLAHYLDRYQGNRELVLAAYYQGQSATDRHGVYAMSRPYVASILRLESLFGG